MIDFGREVCGNLALSAGREWLVTNGIGGYASGTMAGLLTRRYHGLLIAALKPPLGRTLLLTKLDETAAYDGRLYPLFANRWASGLIDPAGFHHLERFHLEGTTPVWTFACADALLEKRIWMQPGANTTYARYDLRRASAPLTLTIKALVNYRDHHGGTRACPEPCPERSRRGSRRATGWRMNIEPVAHGLRVTAFEGASPFYLLSDRAEATPQHDWYREFFLSVEAYRGLEAHEDHLHAGGFHATLHPGQSLTLVASTEAKPNLNGASAYAERQAYERRLMAQSDVLSPVLSRVEGLSKGGHTDVPAWVQHLVLAADQFIVRRPLLKSPTAARSLPAIPGSEIGAVTQ